MFPDFAADIERTLGFERALLGTILSYTDLFERAEDMLASDFVDPGHQAIFAMALSLYRQEQLSARAVIENMRARDELNTIDMRNDGEAYIRELLTYASSPSIDNYIKNVKDASIKRGIRNAAALMAADANRNDIDADSILDETEERIMQLRRQTLDTGVMASNLMDMFQTRYDASMDGTFVPALYPKIQALKDMLSFYEDQDFPVIAARPGDGKSSLMRWEAYREALLGKRVTIVNLENSELEYSRWLVAMHTGIDANRLRHPRNLSDDEKQRVRDAIAALRALPLKVITMGNPIAREVMRVMLPEVRAGSKSFWVDYIQKIFNGIDNRVTDLSVSSGLLRGFALKHHVVVGCGAQLSRNIVSRGEDAEPEQSDLRESGAIEQDATHLLFPRKVWARPTPQDLSMFPENRDGKVRVIPMRIFIKKNRNGPEGVTDHIKWSKHINRYETLPATN